MLFKKERRGREKKGGYLKQYVLNIKLCVAAKIRDEGLKNDLLNRKKYRPFDLPSGRRVVSSDRRQLLQVS